MAAQSTPPRTRDGRPDLQGFWANSTITPLQRPRELADKPFFTQAEAAEYEKHRRAHFEDDVPAVDRWTAEIPPMRSTAPMHEFACHEANYSMEGMLRRSRGSR